MINFEKFLFKKIPVWIYILTLILGLIFLSLFGSVVRHVAKGGNLTGQIGIVAESIAKFPGKFIRLLNSYDINPNPQIFNTKQKFVLKIHNKELFKKNENGFLLVSSFNLDEGPNVQLFSLKEQKYLYSWKPPLEQIQKKSPNFIDGLNVKKFYRTMHPVLFDNGDLIFHSGGGPLVRIDKCNNLKWIINDFYHHSNVFYDDKLYSAITINHDKPSEYLNDAISIVNAENGEVEKNIEIFNIISKYLKDNLSLIYGIGEFERDLFHLNAIYPIKENDDFFKKNDLVVSLRNLSTILVYRKSTDQIIWIKTGPWINQHDAQYLGDGVFSVFSNNNIRGLEPKDFLFLKNSDVIIYDLKNNTFKRPFSKYLKNAKMRSSGLVEMLDDENAIIQLNNIGEIIRVNPQHKIWTYQNYLGDSKKGMINWSKYLKEKETDLSFLSKDNCK
tara:strand:+ start:2630 stop:3961 length:1332 start_codon:yes stop_codon:yes gene_type:complete